MKALKELVYLIDEDAFYDDVLEPIEMINARSLLTQTGGETMKRSHEFMNDSKPKVMITKQEFEEVISEELKDFLAIWDTKTDEKMFPNEFESIDEWMDHFLTFFNR